MPEIIVGDWKLIMHFRYTYAQNIRGSVSINHAGNPTSDVRRGADSKNYYAAIIAPTFGTFYTKMGLVDFILYHKM